MSDTTMTRPAGDQPVDPSTIDAQPARPAGAVVPGPGDDSQRDDPLPWWGFAAATAGRLWLALVTGALLIATIPAVLLPGWSAHVVVSDSMAPRINTGDVVLSQDRNDYQAGQVIVFDDADRGAVTHRLQSVDGDVLTTKGDANPTADSSPVARDDVLGLGRVLVMFAGLPWVWFHTGQWLALALFILSLLLASWVVSRDRPFVADPRPTPADPVDAGPAEPAPSTGSDADRSGRLRGTRLLIPVGACAVVALAFVVSAIPGTSAAFSATTANSGNTWTAATAPTTTYAAAIIGDSPFIYLRLNEPQPGNNPATLDATIESTTSSQLRAYRYLPASGSFAGTFTLGAGSSANMTPTPNTSAQLVSDGACILPNNSTNTNRSGQLTNPQTFSVEAWIRSTGSEGGKIAGFENTRDLAMSTTYDRHLYQDGNGFVHFGIWTGSATTIKSQAPLNDGQWHHVVGTLSGSNSTLNLYVDGALAASRAGSTAQTNTGWWRFGCGNLNAWTTGTAWSGPVPGNLNVNQSFIGLIDEPAVYQSALTATQVLAHYNLGKP